MLQVAVAGTSRHGACGDVGGTGDEEGLADEVDTRICRSFAEGDRM
jgi:hypothetical protein